MASSDSTLRRDSSEGAEDHTLPLLTHEERSIDEQQHASPTLPASTVPGSTQLRQASSTQLNIQASVAPYPMATGHPVQLPGSDAPGAQHPTMLFLPDLPNAAQLWGAQRTVMLVWLITSILSLLLFAPFFITTGLFLGAEVAAILGIMASSMHLCRRTHADGLELSGQIKLAATCGAAAFFLDCLTAFMDLLIVWSVDCEEDEACNSIMNYVVLFGLYLSWHGYLSVSISARARSLLPMLNPVSSGVVRL